MNISTEVSKALAFDALSHAEEITGKSYKTDKLTEDLGMALFFDHNQRKKDLLKSTGDTYWAMPMPEWIAIIEDMGFKLIFSMEIPDTKDIFRIWWRSGILLRADTHGGINTLNSATADFNYKGPRSALVRCSSSHAGEVDGVDVWDASKDAREGFRHAIEGMEAEGEFLSKWVQKSFLWLLHYNYSKQDGYDYKAISKERIALFPEDVQKSIQGIEK